ncbi:MAG: EscU/YscU/HrcU family type III secretion system export apparatus switch protein [Opitutales bacterium]|nr:EscU/YscU/HrcU family type III secretion system export apparatus switch protein [Opitutales bacterium]
MADQDKDQKTEEPTGKRLNEAFREGTFPKAPEIQAAFMLLASFFALLFYAPASAQTLGEFTSGILSRINEIKITSENSAMWFDIVYKKGMIIMLPFIIPCTAATIVGGGIQTGFKLTPKVLAWKPERLNPLAGLKNLFSKNKLRDFLIEFLKFFAVLIIVLSGVWVLIEDPIFHHPVTAFYTLQFIHRLFLIVFIRLVVAITVIAIINYMFQRKKTMEDLKMTKQEVKDERKNQEGDPQVKGRQRALARSLLQKQMLNAVPDADVVVTNPTHFAIALKYEREEDDAPVILAKGQNLFAQKIKEIARANDVPMVENKPVAQMLFKMGQVGSAIPYELYQIVAEILANVYKQHRYYFHELKKRRKERRDHES